MPCRRLRLERKAYAGGTEAMTLGDEPFGERLVANELQAERLIYVNADRS